MTTISVFEGGVTAKNGKELSLISFLDKIASGEWQDPIFTLRNIKNPEEKEVFKKTLTLGTISGRFSSRAAKNILEHSGFIAMDIDSEDPEEIKKKLKGDKYVYAIFTSCGGYGACVLFKIDPEKHLESFEGISQYLFEEYGIVVDQSGKDVSRARFVSFDPDIYIEDHAVVFKKYPKKAIGKPKGKQVTKEIVFVQSDFDFIIQQIESGSIDITGDYHQWLRIGFAIGSYFGEQGRDYFHRISAFSPKYNKNKCDRQYTECLKEGGVKIATFYYICKENNIQIVSDTVRELSKRAYTHKKARHLLEQSISTMTKFPETDASPELIRDVAEQIFTKDIFIAGSSEIEAGELWLAERNLSWNKITGLLEDNGKEMDDKDFCNLRLSMRKELPDLLRADIADLLGSDAIGSRHDIFDFFAAHKKRNPTGVIKELAACIKSPTGEGTDYVERMLTRWIVGGLANLYEKPTFEESPLMVVLCGTVHGTGKSHFMKYLLPEEMRRYVSLKDFSLLREGAYKRDMDIAITKNWLVWDDEMGGKSKRDHRIIKALLASQQTDVRASYARTDKKRKRIAFFGGTSNDLDVVPDHGEQRRIVPIEVAAIDKVRKDNIDLIDLWMEAYHLYHSGFDYRVLNEDIKFLNAQTVAYQEVTPFDMLIATKFEYSSSERYTLAEIGTRVTALWPTQRWTTTSLGLALKKIGVINLVEKAEGKAVRKYPVREKEISQGMLREFGGYLAITGGTL